MYQLPRYATQRCPSSRCAAECSRNATKLLSQIVPRYNLTSVGLGHRVEQRLLLLRSHTERIVIAPRDNRDHRAFGQRLAFENNLSLDDPSCCNLHIGILQPLDIFYGRQHLLQMLWSRP